MTTLHERQSRIIRQTAQQACRKPLQESGLWFHGDIRDNFYYASYLFVAASKPYELPIQAQSAMELAEKVMLKVLSLQDQDPDSSTYGHWPLNLGDCPEQARIHPLPVELMGPLMVLFYSRYKEKLSPSLQSAYDQAIRHMYQSRYYAEPLKLYHHHEAKHTAAGLIFAEYMQDEELLKASHERVKATCAQLKRHGMTEYGILPWFWHWVQAYATAWEIVQSAEIKRDIELLLEWLWMERADYYLKGAWVGPQSRSLPHDAPADRNTAMDYVQFGDFDLTAELPRVEYAGLLAYEVPEAVRSGAWNRSFPMELKRTYPASIDEPERRLHSYVYMNDSYALGAMWERTLEFDNEQHRWDLTFPVSEGSVNQCCFLHPASEAQAGTLRHSSDAESIAIHRNALAALYRPDAQEQGIVGVLPLGEWSCEQLGLIGQINDVFVTIHLMKPYEMETLSDRHLVRASEAGFNGIVLEAMSRQEAADAGIHTLRQWSDRSLALAPRFIEQENALSVSFTSISGQSLTLKTSDHAPAVATVNGSAVDFSDYKSMG
ncbi:hypothetical protein M6D81_01975 [Paenibacillus sp. J5C_2022]|uniref:hypothetical protein n=1 Tax=Paenibacillus sp. J5C2022 TaxID=2977129 RepID=UPI0021D130EC|nr:hypothetical protein [Paenibacillus sp. J5C2022]MCU6707465.1 hypothetical protein [Paenibacillus sp. J5C2022]